ncbi:hypothetical protein WJX84_000181 [Apatococcus fuscideae]|uniref:Uncharacterized protein n=1 Tax=Apatococcus fuscideae TaxID=2026836 RepID=A0AAW1T6Z7_9CHLO
MAAPKLVELVLTPPDPETQAVAVTALHRLVTGQDPQAGCIETALSQVLEASPEGPDASRIIAAVIGTYRLVGLLEIQAPELQCWTLSVLGNVAMADSSSPPGSSALQAAIPTMVSLLEPWHQDAAEHLLAELQRQAATTLGILKALADLQQSLDQKKRGLDTEYQGWEDQLRAARQSLEVHKQTAVEEQNKVSVASAQIPHLQQELAKAEAEAEEIHQAGELAKTETKILQTAEEKIFTKLRDAVAYLARAETDTETLLADVKKAMETSGTAGINGTITLGPSSFTGMRMPPQAHPAECSPAGIAGPSGHGQLVSHQPAGSLGSPQGVVSMLEDMQPRPKLPSMSHSEAESLAGRMQQSQQQPRSRPEGLQSRMQLHQQPTLSQAASPSLRPQLSQQPARREAESLSGKVHAGQQPFYSQADGLQGRVQLSHQIPSSEAESLSGKVHPRQQAADHSLGRHGYSSSPRLDLNINGSIQAMQIPMLAGESSPAAPGSTRSAPGNGPSSRDFSPAQLPLSARLRQSPLQQPMHGSIQAGSRLRPGARQQPAAWEPRQQAAWAQGGCSQSRSAKIRWAAHEQPSIPARQCNLGSIFHNLHTEWKRELGCKFGAKKKRKKTA